MRKDSVRSAIAVIAVIAAAAATAAVAVVPLASAATIRVPIDHPTVDRALRAAGPGDTVLVAPGVYQENIVWPLVQGIVLTGEASPEATILDGGGALSVIGVYGSIDSTTVIRRLTLQHGHAEGM